MTRVFPSLCALVLVTSSLACAVERTWTEQEAADIGTRMHKYVLAPMPFDASAYSEREKELLRRLIAAAKLADEIFWRQSHHDNISLRESVVQNRSEDDPVRMFFFMQAGPYDRLAHDEPFMDVPPKPPGAGFYPPDLTGEEFESWIANHPEDKEAFLSPYTAIQRQGWKFVAVPYHFAYRPMVEEMAAALREAADLAENAGFAKYLRSKAEAVLSDEYFQTDVDWIDMKDSRFDMVFGPFEVYEDALNNLKAGYEASVEIVDLEESARLDVYKQHLAGLEANLPYPEAYKNREPGLTASFVIVRDIYRGGHIRVGYQPVAANLPNDPQVHQKKGTKKTFWKNVMEARLNRIIIPIGRRIIAEDQVDAMTGQGYFDFVLMHEIAHGIGPRFVHGSETPVNVALRELYSWIEENKADMAGLHSLKYFRDRSIIDADMRREHFVSYLGSIFRTIRFGTGEAHGKAAIVSLNFLMEHGGISYDSASRRYAVNFEKIDNAVALLAKELLLIEAEGGYARAKRLAEKYGGTPDFVQASLHSLQDLPIDLVPQYEIRW
ncbi:MAG: hypothetical protein HYY36_05420 [Gammaproteobacteria bacterium]|nr:hypothetical protein [Gammaproteobacteria bacterium]